MSNNTNIRTTDAAGWAVAIVVILAVIIAGVFYFWQTPSSGPSAGSQVGIPNTGVATTSSTTMESASSTMYNSGGTDTGY